MSFCMKERGLYENGWSSSRCVCSTSCHTGHALCWLDSDVLGINRDVLYQVTMLFENVQSPYVSIPFLISHPFFLSLLF